MICILCLKQYDQVINIFEKQGLDFDIDKIIAKHFWLRPNENNSNSKSICFSCWKQLDSFHRFYEKVEYAHSTLFNLIPFEDDGLKLEAIPEIFEVCGDMPAEISDIKKEINEDSKEIQQEFDIEKPIDPFDAVGCAELQQAQEDIKSESESEIPLAKLAKYKISEKVKRNSKNIRNTSIKIKRKQNVTKEDVSGENTYEEWPTSSYDDEINHKIGSQHSDGLIKFNMKLSCSFCDSPMENFAVLKEHYRTEHDETGYVSCCDKKFCKRGSLVEHILLHKYPEYFKCDICDRILASRKNLKEHKKGHDKKFLFECDICSKRFHRQLLLDRHRVLHISEAERTFKCEDCDKFFASKFTLGQHIFGVHKGGYAKMCDKCGKVIRDLDAFRRHQLMHTDDPKPFVNCDKCGIQLSTRTALNRHNKAKHSENEIPHVCNVCGTVKSSIYALKRHITYMHKYKRTFKCALCDKGFKRAIVLKEHMSTHTGEVLYTCPHCPKTFNSNANMHSHRKKMHRKEWEENRRHPHIAAASNPE